MDDKQLERFLEREIEEWERFAETQLERTEEGSNA